MHYCDALLTFTVMHYCNPEAGQAEYFDGIRVSWFGKYDLVLGSIYIFGIQLSHIMASNTNFRLGLGL
jgi:hypothetical protein